MGLRLSPTAIGWYTEIDGRCRAGRLRVAHDVLALGDVARKSGGDGDVEEERQPQAERAHQHAKCERPTLAHVEDAPEAFLGERIVRLIEDAGGHAEYIPNRKAVGDRLTSVARPGDRIVIMGARDDTLSQFARDLFQRF